MSAAENYTITPKGLMVSIGVDAKIAEQVVWELESYCERHGVGLALVEGKLRFVTLFPSEPSG